MNTLFSASILLLTPLLANAQFGAPSGSGNPYSNGNNPYSNGGDDGGDHGGSSGDFGSGFGSFGPPADLNKVIAAHAIMATLAFGLLFPSGSILIRLGSFRGLWLVHGIFQLLVYLLYIVAFGIGVWMATHLRIMNNAHPIVGVICLVLLFFQPFLGFIHHFAFKKHSRRVVWSYAHIWLGRIVITLGIVNGGLGLQLSMRIGRMAPPQSAIIGYAVAATIIWLIYVASAIYGESKRRKANYAAVNQKPPPYKLERGNEDGQSA